MVESKESSPVDEEERKKEKKKEKKKGEKKDDVDTSLVLEGIDLFVGLWEAQPCLWSP